MTRSGLTWFGPLLLLLGSACTCDPSGVDKQRFACVNNADCASGFICSGRVCVSSGTGGGSATGGGGSATGGGGGGFPETGGGAGGGGGSAVGGGTATGGGGAATGGGTATGGGGSSTGGGTATGGGGSSTGGGTATGGGGSSTGGGTATGGGGSSTGGGAGTGGGTATGGGGAATGGGSGTGGGGGGPVDAGPDHIVITSAAQTGVGVSTCASAVTFELHHPDGGLAPVNSTTNISLSAMPATGFTFYSGPGCSTVTSSIPLTTGQSSGSFRWQAGSAGNWTINVTHPLYVGDSQVQGVGYPTADGLAFIGLGGSLPYTMRAGECSAALQLYLTHQGTEVQANTLATITLTEAPLGVGMPAGSLKVYSDATCTTQITGNITIPVNQSRTQAFYLKALTGQAYTVNATAGTLVTSTSHIVLPAVRWSSCGFDAGQALTDCTLAPGQTQLSNAFAISTSASAESGGSGSPMCSLEAAGYVECTRGVAGGPVMLSVETAELPKATVTRGKAQCSGDGGVFISASGFTLGETVALISATDSTASLLNESFHTASLSSTGLYAGLGDCSQSPQLAYQLVDLPGVTVDRGSVQLDAGAFFASTGTPTGTPTNLVSFRVVGGTADVCSTGMRADNFASSSQYNRGLGATNCRGTTLALDYQRMSNPSASVISHQQQNSITMAAGVSSATFALAGSYDATRTLVFVGSQLMGGQGSGEETGPGAAAYGDQLLMVTPQFTGVSLTGLTFTRGSSVQNGKWTFTVIELIP